MGIWRWWMCWFVDCDKYFTVYTCHMITWFMEYVHITLLISLSKAGKEESGRWPGLNPSLVINPGFTWDHEAFCPGMFCTPPPKNTLLKISCGVSPQECSQAVDDSDLDPALSTRALSIHFWDWDQVLGEGRVLCSKWGWTRACYVTWRGSWVERRCPLLLCT